MKQRERQTERGDIENVVSVHLKISREFPGGPVVRTPHFHCRTVGDTGLIPGQGTKIPHAVWSKK